MEVILRQHVENVGDRGEIVRVADGYARNYLLPRKLALRVTDANRRQIERERKVIEAREAGERAAAMALADRLVAVECIVARRVGEKDALYGSVTAADIAESLVTQKLDIDKRKIQLAEPIKQLGEFTVPVKLYRDVTAQVKVSVVREQQEEP